MEISKREQMFSKFKRSVYMFAIRRYALILVVLVVGIILGTLGLEVALIILTPLVLMWLMLWDEKSYRRSLQKEHNLSCKNNH